MMYQNVLNYTKQYLSMIRFLFLVSTLTFLDLGIFGDIILFNVCLKNEFFRSCFQQSAKCKMTAQPRRRNHVFSKDLTL